MNGHDFNRSYDFQTDLKNYHVVVDPTEDYYYMGGTFFPQVNNPEYNTLHFLKFDFNGNIVFSTVYDVFDHDERCVALVDDAGTGHKFIVGHLREQGSNPGFERVKILELDNLGTILNDYVIESSGGNNLDQIYPMDAAYDDSYIYICGYVSNATNPNQPDFFTTPFNSKEIFIMKFEVATGVVSQFQTYDFAALSNADYDMAMRIRVFSVNGTTALFVTGRCSVISGGQEGSAALLMRVDPVNLSTYTAFPFAEYVNSNIVNYGVDVVQNGIDPGYYVFGNNGLTSSSSTGYFPVVPAAWVNYIDPGNTPYAGNFSRSYFSVGDFTWGVHTMESAQATDHIVLGGYASYAPICNFSYPPSQDNVNPFLSDVTLSQTSGDIAMTINDFRVYLSTIGTINNALPNSFWRMGDGLSNITWQPKFANRRRIGTTATDDIFMYAPIEGISSPTLGIKTMRTDVYGNLPICPQSVEVCQPSNWISNSISSVPTAASTSNYNVAINTNYASYEHPLYSIASDNCSNGAFRYSSQPEQRRPILKSITQHLSYSPTSTRFSVKFSSPVAKDDFIEIELTDVLGQTIRTIFRDRGDAFQQVETFDISDVASGLYLVRTRINKYLVLPTKLIVH